MKTKKLLSGLFLLLMLFSCSDSNDPAPLDIFIPNLSNQWASNRNSNFFFLAETEGVNKSNFTGNEQDEDGNVAQLTGNFENYNVQFTFDVSKVTYSGKFIKGSKPLRMELKGSDGKNLVITRQE